MIKFNIRDRVRLLRELYPYPKGAEGIIISLPLILGDDSIVHYDVQLQYGGRIKRIVESDLESR